MNRTIGYLISVAGLVVLVLGIAPFNEELVSYFPVLSGIPYYLFFGSGLIIVIVGILFLRKSSGRQPAEVPIYHGKNIVGYRRMK
ncbi:MAG: hypothetical protein QXH60_03000 [Candidatus Pacearchaeota archaeon]